LLAHIHTETHMEIASGRERGTGRKGVGRDVSVRARKRTNSARDGADRQTETKTKTKTEKD